MKKALENIVNSVVDTGKKVINHIKEHAKVYTLMTTAAVAGYNVDKVIPEVNAADIRVKNVIFDSDQGKYVQESTTWLKTGENYQEKFLTSEGDFSHFDDPTNDLDIYTKEFNDPNQIGLNAKRNNTPGWEVYFEADANVTNMHGNDVEIIVDNNEGLENRKVIAYDVNNPNTIYEIPKNGSVWWKSLSETTNLSSGEYATWHIATPAIVPGDCASELGPGKLDGKVDLYDALTVYDDWLTETFEGENYSFGDLNYDGINNLEDHAIIGANWLSTASE